MNVRYRLAPQLRDYDTMLKVATPYLAFSQPCNYCSKSANTDENGFRISSSVFSGDVTSLSWSKYSSKKGLLLGGSFAFGDGSTSDDNTLASFLNKNSNFIFMNLGIRAGNSLQELISSIPYLLNCIAIRLV